MDIQDFLSINYLDLFENTESNLMLQDNLQSDWLDNIFSSSSSSSSDSSSLTTTRSDCLLPDSISPSPDSGLPSEHSYSIGQTSPSTNSWSSAPDSGDSIDYLNDFRASDIDLTSDLVKESEALETRDLFFTADDGETDSDLDRWLESSISSPSSSPSLPEPCDPIDVPKQPPKRNVVLFTSIDGQVLKFTSEESEISEELVLVDCDYVDESPKDPIDLSVCRSTVSSSFEDQENGSSVIRRISTQRIGLNGLSGGLINNRKDTTCRSYTLTEALFSSPVPTEGLLLLTDEEKNTLITDGYPVPTKLPLGKAEEKYLKKIRRKIKNKLSAQESRRKKREYVDHLETKMHKYCEENTTLLKKVQQLESNNRLLLGQLQKMMKYSGSLPSSGGTRLMVVALFFAVFVGTWSPISWRVGFGRVSDIKDRGAGEAGGESGVWALHPMRCAAPVGPDLQLPVINSGVSARSRLLMSTKDEEDDDDGGGGRFNPSSPFGPSVPASYMTTIAFWFNGVTNYGLPGYPELNARSTAPPPRDVDQTDDDEMKMGADDAAAAAAAAAELGFSVQQILPLTEFRVFRDAHDARSSNVTFVGFSSPTQPMLPVTRPDQPAVHQMTL